MKFNNLVLLLLLCLGQVNAQEKKLKFAVITDIHFGREGTKNSLGLTINDINKDSTIQFVLVTGDLTDRGRSEEIIGTKELLERLNKPYHAIPGNHEMKWSANGGTLFRKLFGSECFKTVYSDYCFIGTNCGPVLRTSVGHIPSDNLHWLDSTLSKIDDKAQPIIFVNHMPMDSSIDNSDEVFNRLQGYNIQLFICGHGHVNKQMNLNGIPGIMCRTNQPLNNRPGIYNIVEIKNHIATFRERIPQPDSLLDSWATVKLKSPPKALAITLPDYSTNKKYPGIKMQWQYKHSNDIGGGFAMDRKAIYTGSSDGYLISIDKVTGKKIWDFKTGGRIFSTPALNKHRVVFTSTDSMIYCISDQGKFFWSFHTDNCVVSSPVINGDTVFVGGSDGHFRALDLSNGKLIWDFDSIQGGYVETRPLIYQDKIYFGAWNGKFYALSRRTGKLEWVWDIKKNPVFSPAACWPVAANGRIFIVLPDRSMACLDAATGKIIWHQKKSGIPVFESMGLSGDGSMVYVKTLTGRCYGISTASDTMATVWKAAIDLHYELCPTPIPDNKSFVYLPTYKGDVIGISKASHEMVWKYKASNSLINMIMTEDGKLYISGTDGTISCLVEGSSAVRQ